MSGSPPPIPTFVQRSRIGWAAFQVHGDCLEISASDLGKKTKGSLLLRSIDSAHQCLSQRVYLLWVAPLIFSAICAAATWGILQLDEPMRSQAWLPGLSLCAFLAATVRGIPPVVFYEFRDHWGRVRFNIVRERKQANECDAFVAQLVARIQIASSALSPAAFADLLAQLESSAGTDGSRDFTFEIGQDRWKVSIVAGAFAVALPLIPGIAYYLDGFAFLLLFILCTGGLALGVLSFLAKESKRWFAVLGMALSLIPPFFYRIVPG